jgi:hypothetical protein
MRIALIRKLALSGIVCALMAAGATGGMISPVSASSRGIAAVQPGQAPVTTTADTQDPVASVDVTSGSDAAPNDSIGNPCATGWAMLSYKDAVGVVLFWFKMTTDWCYNFSIVTYHDTKTYFGITFTGSAGGWAFDKIIEATARCYVAYGSTRNCSGNYEDREGNFRACVVVIGCYDSAQPYLQEWETYQGNFYWSR